MAWITAYLSIGSNKGDTRKNLDLAIRAIDAREDIRITAVSGFYKTAPQNFLDQDWFLNAALRVETSLSPEALLSCLKSLETAQDETGKSFRFGPRIIDLDIVLYGNEIRHTESLELPHPRMHERAFVLRPLCDIDDTLVHPVLNRCVKDLLEKITTQEDQEVIPLDQED